MREAQDGVTEPLVQLLSFARSQLCCLLKNVVGLMTHDSTSAWTSLAVSVDCSSIGFIRVSKAVSGDIVANILVLCKPPEAQPGTAPSAQSACGLRQRLCACFGVAWPRQAQKLREQACAPVLSHAPSLPVYASPRQ